MQAKDAILVILKELRDNKRLMVADELGCNNIQYGELIQELETRNLIFGTKIVRSGDDNKISTILSKDTKISSLGKMYIDDNDK